MQVTAIWSRGLLALHKANLLVLDLHWSPNWLKCIYQQMAVTGRHVETKNSRQSRLIAEELHYRYRQSFWSLQMLLGSWPWSPYCGACARVDYWAVDGVLQCTWGLNHGYCLVYYHDRRWGIERCMFTGMGFKVEVSGWRRIPLKDKTLNCMATTRILSPGYFHSHKFLDTRVRNCHTHHLYCWYCDLRGELKERGGERGQVWRRGGK